MRRCSLLAALVALVAFVAAGAGHAGPPPRLPVSSVDVWGQPARAAEVAGRPLGTTLALFGSTTLAARLPVVAGSMQPLAVVAAHFRGRPGALRPADTRRVDTAIGPLYLVPTVRGWLCLQGPSFETCHRGLLRQDITWDFYSTPAGVDVIGIAADTVSAVTLTDGPRHWRATLKHNVFAVYRPITLSSARHLPPLGRLTVSYRNGNTTTSVALP